MVYCVRKINWKKVPAQVKAFRNYVNYDHIKFYDKLKDVEFTPSGDTFVCVNNLWHFFRSAFVSVAARHAPTIQKPVRGINNCPWINKNIKHAIHHREYLLRTARKSNRLEKWASY